MAITDAITIYYWYSSIVLVPHVSDGKENQSYLLSKLLSSVSFKAHNRRYKIEFGNAQFQVSRGFGL